MNKPHLIILYGKFGYTPNPKQQKMIVGGCTCMYREYAKKYGEIIYLQPQNCYQDWEMSICSPDHVLEYLSAHPDSIVWSVKHDPEKDKILKLISNKKVYYSCCNRNMYNKHCDISLVDLPERVKGNGNAVLWVKGKDPDYWLPSNRKWSDILLIGHRGDKNELFFLEKMKESKKEYDITWIGGIANKQLINTKHQVLYTPFLTMDKVRKTIPGSKIGIILSEHPCEGFPQTFLEMTMCGLPVVYLSKGLPNRVYSDNMYSIIDKNNVVDVVENLIKKVNDYPVCSAKTRDYAIENYSIERSYESILKGLKLMLNNSYPFGSREMKNA